MTPLSHSLPLSSSFSLSFSLSLSICSIFVLSLFHCQTFSCPFSLHSSLTIHLFLSLYLSISFTIHLFLYCSPSLWVSYICFPFLFDIPLSLSISLSISFTLSQSLYFSLTLFHRKALWYWEKRFVNNICGEKKVANLTKVQSWHNFGFQKLKM